MGQTAAALARRFYRGPKGIDRNLTYLVDVRAVVEVVRLVDAEVVVPWVVFPQCAASLSQGGVFFRIFGDRTCVDAVAYWRKHHRDGAH